MIEELLPPQVAAAEMREDDESAYLFPEEASGLSGAAVSRVKEFATTRTCARHALQQLGCPALPIGRGRNREPIWPAGFVGSITHCRGYRAAAVAMQSDVIAIGIDSEPHVELPPDILNQVAFGRERFFLEQVDRGIHWDRVLFSAKESIYKAWYPITGRWLGFEDVEVTFRSGESAFDVRLVVPPPIVDGRRIAEFSGRYMVRDDLLLTAVVLLAPTRP